MDKILFFKKTETVYEGAGVKLNRVFSHDEIKLTDPFLLLDHFESKNEEDYIRGFPWHPHRGIETVTYLKKGKVEHQDSLGNKGVISAGDIQWMTAGSGIIHQEMPLKTKDGVKGFQLWVNLPKKYKMTHPKYRGITKKDIKIDKTKDFETVLISDKITDLSIPIVYHDLTLFKDKQYLISTKKDYTNLIYIYEGEVSIDGNVFDSKTLIALKESKSVELIAKSDSHFLHISGKKIEEPIAWAGPIVMNTQKELEIAFEEYRTGTFLKSKKSQS